MDTVLFVDDEPEYVADYIEELEKSFRVDFCQTAEESVQKIRQNNAYQAIVMDVQMPPPKDVSPLSTNNGVDTGLWILRQVQETIIMNSLPVILLTNRNLEVVKSGVQKLGLSEEGVEIRPKATTSYAKLSKLVDDMVPHLIHSEATLARLWPDNSGAVRVNNDRVGWLEFDVSAMAIPKDVRVGDRFGVSLKLDRYNNVLSYQIPANMRILPHSTETFGQRLSKEIPKFPLNLDDSAAIARYREELASWTKASGLK